jgi:hypothetical protein
MGSITNTIRLLGDIMLDKLMGSFVTMMKSKSLKPADESPKDETVAAAVAEPVAELKDELEDIPVAEPKAALDPVLVSQWEVQLERFVYDPELAKELAPVFVSLLRAEGFDKVIDLLETKEKQIEAISGSSQHQQTDPLQKQEVKEVKPTTATDILKSRYK